jgi:hypothetical protein
VPLLSGLCFNLREEGKEDGSVKLTRRGRREKTGRGNLDVVEFVIRLYVWIRK